MPTATTIISEAERCRYDVVVAGGGASGLAAALAAARGGAHVCVLERDVEAGLPLLATGNGRCNLSNAHLDPARYRHPDAFRAVAGLEPEAQVAAFFDSLGLMMAEEDEGRLYPVTRRAESVRDVLLHGCAREGVELRCACSLVSARYDVAQGLWSLELREPAAPLKAKPGRDNHASVRNKRKALEGALMADRTVLARRIVLACGEKGSLEELAALFSLPYLPEEPVLCPLACTLDMKHAGKKRAGTAAGSLTPLDGLRVHGSLTLLRDDKPLAHEQGEVLFRSYGLSGIAAFNLSRHVQKGDSIVLDLFPALSEDELLSLLQHREHALGPYRPGNPSWFDGLLVPVLGALVDTCVAGEAAPLAQAASTTKHLTFAVEGTTGHEQAQAHRGGIPLGALDLATCAALPAHAPAPHVCGAALDMDADCGGFNLAWAWLSGLRAGTAAAVAALSRPQAHRGASAQNEARHA